MRKFRFRIGFTLLEVLMACALMVLFQGVALPRYRAVARLGKEARVRSDLHLVRVAIDALLLNERPRALPPDMDSLLGTLRETGSRILGGSDEFYDPFGRSGTRYGYFRNGTCYVVFSTGVDGKAQIRGVNFDCKLIPENTGDDLFVTNAGGGQRAWP